MSAGDCFFDTSIVLYLLSADAAKADTAEGLLRNPGNISVQVLNEFAAVGKGKLKLSFAEITDVLGTLRSLCSVHPLTEETYDQGIKVAEEYRFSVYDSMIVASALLSGCEILYSEDLQHRQVVNGRLQVINPFART